ncbi:partial phosphoribosylformylglycinamidine synthase, partial [uncultured bacterium]
LVLGGGAPVYKRETKKPDYIDAAQTFSVDAIPEPADMRQTMLQVFSSPNIVSKRWVYEQYDSMVRTNTIVGPGCDSAVVMIKDTNKALAMKTDCNGRYVYLNPRRGAQIAVAESARNVVCSGGEPLAITNCLNFGNPYKPEIYWQFSEAVKGMGEACSVFETPVTGGNVSFYNESPDAAVYPTPVIGMVGLIEDLNHITTSYFKGDGDIIMQLGEDHGEIGGSEYLKRVHDTVSGDAPVLDLENERRLHQLLLKAIREGIINSAHDCSDGGVFVTIAESCIINREKKVGAKVTVPVKNRVDVAMFSESQSRIIISLNPENKYRLEAMAGEFGINCLTLGVTGGDALDINNHVFTLTELEDIYFNTISRIMHG